MLPSWIISASALRENGYEFPAAVPGFSEFWAKGKAVGKIVVAATH